jgi:predicted Zn finger-like uncharacterized protein
MIVICEDCGRKYRIDPQKIKGRAAKFSCKSCNHVILVANPRIESTQPPPPPFIEAESDDTSTRTAEIPSVAGAKTSKQRKKPGRAEDKRRISLRTKMFLLFFLLPIALFSVSAYLFVRQMDSLSTALTSESRNMIEQLAEDKIADISRQVASQCRLYLLANPGLRRENFNRDINFKRLAVQRVGMTGYTALYELPGREGVWRTWAHVNDRIIGIDMATLKKALGVHFTGFWDIYTGVNDGGESRGYYTWRDKDGRLRQKFMVCTPVEGTSYVIAATTYLEEFTRQITQLEFRSSELTAKNRLIILGILLGAIVVIAAIVSFYGHRLTKKLNNLTELAERISIGELDAEIQIRSNDEIGDLVEAISRMQESIRLSIERLRHRK